MGLVTRKYNRRIKGRQTAKPLILKIETMARMLKKRIHAIIPMIDEMLDAFLVSLTEKKESFFQSIKTR